jgi:hypothetical protein
MVLKTVSKDELEERLKGIPGGLLRLKGRLPAAGGGTLDVQCVDTRFTVTHEEDLIEKGFLVAIGRRESSEDWQQWVSDLFAWLQGQPDTPFVNMLDRRGQDD